MAGFSWLSDVSHAILEAFPQVAEKAAQIDRWFLCHSGQPCHLEATAVSLAITGQLRGRPARPRATYCLPTQAPPRASAAFNPARYPSSPMVAAAGIRTTNVLPFPNVLSTLTSNP